MEIKLKLIKVGHYHVPSKFTGKDGTVFDVPANWDALAQSEDGDIAQVRMRGLSPDCPIKAGMVATINAASVSKQSGVWVVKGDTVLSK